jgi:hypothetical protein
MNYLLSTPKFKHIQKEIGEILLKYDISSEDKDKITEELNEVIKTTLNYDEEKDDYATMYYHAKLKDKINADVETKESYLAKKREINKKWLSNPENLEKKRASARETQRKLREKKKLEANTVKINEKLDICI